MGVREDGVALITGGGDRPYALGLLDALVRHGLRVDFIASDDLDVAWARSHPRIRFLNLRGKQDASASWVTKAWRVARYYGRLLAYCVRTECRVVHMLWANRFIFVDRILLPSLCRLLSKRVVFTAHNVNERERDGGETLINRITLRYLYRSVSHVFVHTQRMKRELTTQFGIAEGKVSVIPFGINNTLPCTSLSGGAARRRLGLEVDERVLLFFGNIAPYKGLELAIEALELARNRFPNCRLVIAGRVKGCQPYWKEVELAIRQRGLDSAVIRHLNYVPDDEVETYFKAADVVLLPYRFIYQSGVLFLAYSFGKPVIATAVGSLEEDVVVGVTGMICPPNSGTELGRTVIRFFDSDLYHKRQDASRAIVEHGNRKHSWEIVAEITSNVYDEVLGGCDQQKVAGGGGQR